MKFVNNIDLQKNELQNPVLQNLSGAPSSPKEGQFYYDTTNDAAYIWNGAAWIPTDARKATDIPNTALATNPLARANHTGTQSASTISDLSSTVQGYSLDQFAAPVDDVDFNGQVITGLGTPTNPTDAATKGYVDTAVQSAAAGIDAKPSVRLLANTNISLTGTQTIDGVGAVAGDRILAIGQSTASQNGVYVVAAGAWSRAGDADENNELTPGAFWYVETGTTYGKTQWRIENSGAITVGTTAITINQFGSAGTYTAGAGLELNGNEFAVVAGTGIIADGTSTRIDTTVVARKYSTTIGDGAATSITVTHNLNTQDIIVSVREVATNNVVIADVQANAANTCVITFGTAPTNNQYRVSVIG